MRITHYKYTIRITTVLNLKIMLTNYFFKNLSGLGLVVFLLLGAGQVKAQEDNPGPRFGIKGGVNFSQLYVDQPNAEDENIKLGR